MNRLRIEYLFAILLFTPPSLYLISFFGFPALAKVAGYLALFSLLIFIVVAITGTIAQRKYFSDPETKTKRVNSIIDALITNPEFEISFKNSKTGNLKASCKNSELFTLSVDGNRQNINRSDLFDMLLSAKDLRVARSENIK